MGVKIFQRLIAIILRKNIEENKCHMKSERLLSSPCPIVAYVFSFLNNTKIIFFSISFVRRKLFAIFKKQKREGRLRIVHRKRHPPI